MNTRKWLAAVRDGMDVFDRNGDKIGTVKQIYFGAAGDEVEGGYVQGDIGDGDLERDRSNFLFDEVAEAIAGVSDIPEEVRERLLQHGYVQVDRGLLQSDGYVLSEHVVNVTDEGVTVNVDDDDLITL